MTNNNLAPATSQQQQQQQQHHHPHSKLGNLLRGNKPASLPASPQPQKLTKSLKLNPLKKKDKVEQDDLVPVQDDDDDDGLPLPTSLPPDELPSNNARSGASTPGRRRFFDTRQLDTLACELAAEQSWERHQAQIHSYSPLHLDLANNRPIPPRTISPLTPMSPIVPPHASFSRPSRSGPSTPMVGTPTEMSADAFSFRSVGSARRSPSLLGYGSTAAGPDIMAGLHDSPYPSLGRRLPLEPALPDGLESGLPMVREDENHQGQPTRLGSSSNRGSPAGSHRSSATDPKQIRRAVMSMSLHDPEVEAAVAVPRQKSGWSPFSSRPGSRAGSRAASRAASRAPSRSGTPLGSKTHLPEAQMAPSPSSPPAMMDAGGLATMQGSAPSKSTPSAATSAQRRRSFLGHLRKPKKDSSSVTSPATRKPSPPKAKAALPPVSPSAAAASAAVVTRTAHLAVLQPAAPIAVPSVSAAAVEAQPATHPLRPRVTATSIAVRAPLSVPIFSAPSNQSSQSSQAPSQAPSQRDSHHSNSSQPYDFAGTGTPQTELSLAPAPVASSAAQKSGEVEEKKDASTLVTTVRTEPGSGDVETVQPFVSPEAVKSSGPAPTMTGSRFNSFKTVDPIDTVVPAQPVALTNESIALKEPVKSAEPAANPVLADGTVQSAKAVAAPVAYAKLEVPSAGPGAPTEPTKPVEAVVSPVPVAAAPDETAKARAPQIANHVAAASAQPAGTRPPVPFPGATHSAVPNAPGRDISKHAVTATDPNKSSKASSKESTASKGSKVKGLPFTKLFNRLTRPSRNNAAGSPRA